MCICRIHIGTHVSIYLYVSYLFHSLYYIERQQRGCHIRFLKKHMQRKICLYKVKGKFEPLTATSVK